MVMTGTGTPSAPRSNTTLAARPKVTSRRDFLKNTSLTLGGLSLAASGALAVETAPRKVRIGVVGGGFGCSFQWHEHPDCVVEAVSDLRPERRDALMRTYKCSKSYPSLEELVLDKNIDAVAIFTEAPNHVKHVVEAMSHGKHVISAVPACFATVEEADRLRDIVRKTGLTYMMAETSYYQQHTISVRKFYQEGRFGELYYCQSEYQHDGLEYLYNEPYGDPSAKRTWRFGLAPMHYPTHCTAHLLSVTGERLTQAVCHGWGDQSAACTDNPYGNPFWDCSAMFRTDRGHAFRVNVWWKGAHRGCERAEWIGTKMSFYAAHPNGLGPVIVRSGTQQEKDDAGFVRNLPNFEKYEQVQWWKADMLPEPLRHDTGHEGSHSFLTHEFIDALTHGRRPTVDVYEALSYTVPGIIAHRSALKQGEQLPIPQYPRPA